MIYNVLNTETNGLNNLKTYSDVEECLCNSSLIKHYSKYSIFLKYLKDYLRIYTFRNIVNHIHVKSEITFNCRFFLNYKSFRVSTYFLLKMASYLHNGAN